MLVKDFMIREYVSIDPEKNIEELILSLVEKKVNGMPVVNKNRELVGMITDGDVFQALKPETPHTLDFFEFFEYYMDHQLPNYIHTTIKKQVKEVMTKRNILTIREEDSVEEVATLFAKNRYKEVPVVNKSNELVGVVSRSDVLHYIVKDLLKK